MSLPESVIVAVSLQSYQFSKFEILAGVKAVDCVLKNIQVPPKASLKKSAKEKIQLSTIYLVYFIVKLKSAAELGDVITSATVLPADTEFAAVQLVVDSVVDAEMDVHPVTSTPSIVSLAVAVPALISMVIRFIV